MARRELGVRGDAEQSQADADLVLEQLEHAHQARHARSSEAEAGEAAEADGLGAEQRLLQGTVNRYATSWSPDGRQVVYHKRLPGNASRMRKTLSLEAEFELFLTDPFPTYSRSGEHVLVSRNRPNFLESSLDLMDADGGGVQTIFFKEGKMAMNPAWSPDGRQIAFGPCRQEIHVASRADLREQLGQIDPEAKLCRVESEP